MRARLTLRLRPRRAALVLIPLLVVLTLLGLTPARGAAAAASDYAGRTFGDYLIPDVITQVVLDNSTYSDGSTPAARGFTPATFTLAEVAKLETISLATVTANADGTVTSTPNATVGAWVASATDTNLYEIDANAYVLNRAGTVDSPTGSLATAIFAVNGHAERPPFNFLMQIIASAESATLVNLTGVTAQISDSPTAQRLMALFQTDRLPKLRSLLLGSNNLTNLSENWLLTSTLLWVGPDQRVTALDLSHNGMTSVAWGTAFAIGNYLTRLDLSGNATTQISGTLDDLLSKIITNDGSGDLSDATLAVNDWNTLHSALALINADTGSLTLNDASVNAIVMAAPGELNDSAVTQYLPQMTVESVQKLLDENKTLSDTVRDALQDYVDNGGQVTPVIPETLAVSGLIDFGRVSLADLGQTQTAASTLVLQATLDPGSAIMVSMDPWTGTDGAQFTATLTLNDNLMRGYSTPVTTVPQTFFVNEQTTVYTGSASITSVALDIPAAEQDKVRTQRYTTTLNWTIENSVTTNLK